MPTYEPDNTSKSIPKSIEISTEIPTEIPIEIPTESIEIPTESIKSSQRKPYGKRIIEEDEILLFQLCIQHSLSFQLGNRKSFWLKISTLFQETTGKPYSWQSVSNKIETLSIKRKVILQQKKTGTTSIDEVPLNQVIDQWIEIWDTMKEKEKSQKLSKVQ